MAIIPYSHHYRVGGPPKLYWGHIGDNGKEKGNYHIKIGYISGIF